MHDGGELKVFSTELGYTLEAAWREASVRQHAYFTVEHLLYGLLHDSEVERVLLNCGADVGKLKKELEKFFDEHVEKASGSDEEKAEPVQTPAVQRVLQRAIIHMHSAGKSAVKAEDVLIALFSERDAHAVFFLKKQSVERMDVLQYISHGVSKVETFDDDDDEVGLLDGDEEEGDEDDEDGPRRSRGSSALELYGEELTAKAAAGELDPIIGRETELSRALKVLSRRQKNNPLFLGDPGVGKTAMAHAIAQKIADGEVPEPLEEAKIFSLNMGALIAGTKFRGEFEDRLKRITKELQKIPKAILYIDEIHQLVGAGATGTGSMDAANLLKPVLGSGKMRCIGSTTHEDYKKHFEKDRALNRRFTTIDLDEPSIEQTIEILEGLKGHFEEHHGVKFSKNALKAAANLSAKHINDRFLPDKAIDVIDEAGAANSLLPKSKRKKTIKEKEVETVVSDIAKVPVNSVGGSDEEALRNLETRLKAQVFGQDEACAALALAMKRAKANLQQEQKPLGSFLFAGPTGVGKTELARVLAKELGVHFHRFDMSEYMEKHAVARFIGAPPGYVGYEEGGQLTDLVRKHPYSVLLLDEIEKAHEDIFNILLQVMDDASLTDSHGKKADFRNVIMIMTTNAGSTAARSIGFGQGTSSDSRERAIKKMFRPEFRNRLDETVYFQSLPTEVIRLVVEKFVAQLEGQLVERRVTFQLTDEVKDWLAVKGFDEQLGARPMARVIQKEIKDPLADQILFGKLKDGGSVSVSLEDGKLHFDIESQEKPAQADEPSHEEESSQTTNGTPQESSD